MGLAGTYTADNGAIDHNMYVKGNLVFQANYLAGLRVLTLDNIENAQLEEVAFSDTTPGSNIAEFEGIWSVYPYFDSGNIILSGINGHLYIVKLQ